MQKFGSDVVLDLWQYYRFDYIGWVMGRVDARPEFVFCMVEGLPMDSRYKILSLPNPNGYEREHVLYSASGAHGISLASQQILAWAGKGAKVNDVAPPWMQEEAPRNAADGMQGEDRLKALYAAWGGNPA